MYTRSSREWAKHLDFILWDVACLEAAFIFAFSVRHGMDLVFRQPEYRSLAVIYAILDILIAVLFNTMHNVLKRGFYEEFRQTVKQVSLVLLSVAVYLFAIQMGVFFSRVTIFLTSVFHFALSCGIRLVWKRVLQSFGVGRTKSIMFLIADEQDVYEIVRNAKRAGNVEFSGLVLTDRDAKGEIIAGISVVANLSDAAAYLCREWVDEVFVYARDTEDTVRKWEEGETTGPISDLVDICCEMAIPVHIRLPFNNLASKSFAEKVAGYNVLTLASNYASSMQMAAKRAMDIVGGLVGSVFTLIILLIVGPMIKMASPGPIIFKQTRVGLNGKRFQMYKLRSMYVDAEQRKQELEKSNRVSDGMMFKLDWDPRIIGNELLPDGTRKTGIGEFIRRTSLDEFPQFFNVLLGQMSLVGTRPPTEDEWEKYQYHHRARLATKPGITGMWQVSGRSKITDFEEVVRLDMQYIQNWSMALDLNILLRTIKVVLMGDGAM